MATPRGRGILKFTLSLARHYSYVWSCSWRRSVVIWIMAARSIFAPIDLPQIWHERHKLIIASVCYVFRRAFVHSNNTAYVDISYKQALKTVFNVSGWHRWLGSRFGRFTDKFWCWKYGVGSTFGPCSIWVSVSCRTSRSKKLDRIKNSSLFEARLVPLSEMGVDQARLNTIAHVFYLLEIEKRAMGIFYITVIAIFSQWALLSGKLSPCSISQQSKRWLMCVSIIDFRLAGCEGQERQIACRYDFSSGVDVARSEQSSIR